MQVLFFPIAKLIDILGYWNINIIKFMEKLSKRDLEAIYNQCLRLVRRKPAEFFVFKKLRCCGICSYDDDTILLDHRRSVISTAYHECIHYLYPEWSESRVLYTESRIINSISVLDTTLFLKYLSIKVYKAALINTLLEKKEKKKLKKSVKYTKKIKSK